jgi:hypothetical protein
VLKALQVRKERREDKGPRVPPAQPVLRVLSEHRGISGHKVPKVWLALKVLRGLPGRLDHRASKVLLEHWGPKDHKDVRESLERRVLRALWAHKVFRERLVQPGRKAFRV